MTDELIFGVKYSEIQHAYDPVKAREYYLRTRELKGRQSGTAIPAGQKPRSSAVIDTRSANNSRESQSARNKRRREAAERRVAELKAKLERLETLLDTLVKQAKARSGVEPTRESKSPAQKQSAAKGKSPQTAKEKRDAAKRAKESYEKNKKLSPNKEAENLEADIEAVREKIRKIRADLKATVKKSRTQSTKSKTTAVAKAVRQ